MNDYQVEIRKEPAADVIINVKKRDPERSACCNGHLAVHLLVHIWIVEK